MAGKITALMGCQACFKFPLVGHQRQACPTLDNYQPRVFRRCPSGSFCSLLVARIYINTFGQCRKHYFGQDLKLTLLAKGHKKQAESVMPENSPETRFASGTVRTVL